jgi:cobalt-zinc-cadmium efflux system outer membrane protein
MNAVGRALARPRVPRRRLPLLALALLACAASQASEAPLSLESARERMLERHPALAGRRAELDALRSDALAAGQDPGWEAEVTAENVGGSGAASGIDAAEFTLALSRTVELGGKRALRSARANAETESGRVRLEAELRALERSLALRYFEAIAAGRLEKLAADAYAESEGLVESARARVRSGRSSQAELDTALAAQARLGLELARAQGRRSLAHQALAAAMGEPSLPATPPASFGPPVRLPPADAVPELIEAAPRLRLATSEMAAALAAVELASAQARPDLRLSAGARRLEELDAIAFVFGVTVPIGASRRAEPWVAAARSRATAARADAVHARLLLGAQASEALGRAELARSAVDSLSGPVMLHLDAAQRRLEEGYRLGRFSWIEVAAARAATLEARSAQVSAELDYWTAVADLESLTGRLARQPGEHTDPQDATP